MPTMTDGHDSLDGLKGRVIVLDLASPYVVLGTLVSWDDRTVCLENADVHDLRTSPTTREHYVVDAKTMGIQANRARTLITRSGVVAVAALDDVVT